MQMKVKYIMVTSNQVNPVPGDADEGLPHHGYVSPSNLEMHMNVKHMMVMSAEVTPVPVAELAQL